MGRHCAVTGYDGICCHRLIRGRVNVTDPPDQNQDD